MSVRPRAGLVAAVLGIASALLSVFVLVGWYSGNETLTKINPSYVPMQYNTALGFLVCGLALVAWWAQRVRFAAVLGSVAALVGALTIFEYLFGISLAIDELFMDHPADPNSSHPGRMAPNTALCFMLSGWAFMLAFAQGRGLRANAAIATLGTTVMALGSVSLFGYLTAMETAYGWGNLTHMAVHTAVGFIAVGAGCLLQSLATSKLEPGVGPGWLPIPVGLAGITISLCLAQALSADQARRIQGAALDARQDLRKAMLEGFAVRVRALERMAQRWALRGGTPREEWEADAYAHYEHQPGYQALEWVDPTERMRWTVPARDTAGSWEPDTVGMKTRQRALRVARANRHAVITPTFEVAPNQKGFLCWAPIYHEQEFGGSIVGIIRVRDFLDHTLGDYAEGFHVAVYEGGDTVYRRGNADGEAPREYADRLNASFGGAHWAIQVWPSESFVDNAQTATPLLSLLAGILFSGLLVFALYAARLSQLRHALAQQASERFRNLSQTLEQRVEERTRELASQRRAALNLAHDAEEARQQTLQASQQLERSHRELQKHQERLTALLDATAEAIYGVDPRGNCTFCNRACLEMLGYRSSEDLLGKNMHALIHHHHADGSEYHERDCPIDEAFRRNRGVHVDDEVLFRADGSSFPAEYWSYPILRDGRRIGAVVTLLNITERKESERMLAHRTRQLERSNADLEQFAYVASHDLQEPLRMVASYTELLAQRYEGKIDEKADRYIRYAVEGAKRMQRLINDLLEFGRVDRQAKATERMSAHAALDDALANLDLALNESMGKVVSSELPVIEADRRQLTQLFQNLIGNALKFRSEAAPRVRVSAERGSDCWVFCVRDNGIGLEVEFAERVFQVFKRLHERDRYPGSGIGLAIAKKIVERHGGRIWVESQPDKGAAFYFTWPFAPEVVTAELGGRHDASHSGSAR